MKVKDTYPTAEMKELFQAIVSIDNEKEVAAFFRDLLTTAEITEFANRWQIVKMLMVEKPYAEIAQKLSVSTTTVTRVSHWLHQGMGGYLSVAKKMYSK